MTRNRGIFYGYIIVAISFLAMFLVPGLSNSIGIFFKPIQDDLGWTRTVISGAISLSLIVGGIAGIAIGKMNDRFGPRAVMTFCVTTAAAGYLLMSLLQEVWQLYLFLGILTGVGTNVLVPLLSTVARWFTEKRSMMTGLVICGANAGVFVLPLFISFLFQTQTWRNTFLILGLIILVIGIISAQLLKRDPNQMRQTAPGADDSAEQISNIDTGSFTFKQAIGTRQFWIFAFALFFFGFCYFSIQVHVAAHVTDMGFSSINAATVLSIIGAAAVVGMLGQGVLGDRIGSVNALLLGPISLLIPMVILIFSRNLWAFYIAAALFGFASASSVQISPITAHFFGLRSHGQILGFFMFGVLLGGSIGPLVSGYIFDITGSYLGAFITGAVLAALFLILSILLRKSSLGTVPIPETI